MPSFLEAALQQVPRFIRQPLPQDAWLPAKYAWGRKLNRRLLKLEKEVFIQGYEKAFLLFFDSCNICEVCPGKKEECLEPKLSRPTPEALCVDVYSTVRKIGYPIQVLADYSQKMNRYAFLLVE